MVEKTANTSLVWLIIAVFLVKEAAWLVLVPPREAPDELAHYSYVESLYYEKKLPEIGVTMFSERVQVVAAENPASQSSAAPQNAAVESSVFKPGNQLNWIAQHPPAYYLLLLPLYSVLPHDNVLFSIFVLRFFSILLGAVTVYFSFKTLHRLLPGQDILNTAIVGAIAFLPMFSFMSAVVNNDNLVMALSSVLFYLLACTPGPGNAGPGGKDGSGKAMPEKASVEKGGHEEKSCPESFAWSFKIGIVLALLALTKVTALPIFVTVFIIRAVYFFRAKGKKEKTRQLRDTAVIFGLPLVLAAWWYVRNFFIFHTFFPDLKDAVGINPGLLKTNPEIMQIFPETGPHTDMNLGYFDFLFNKGFLVEYFKNIWGVFGRFFIQLTSWQYVAIAVFTVLGFGGWIVEAFKKHRKKNLEWKKILFSDEMISLVIVLLFIGTISWRVYGIMVDRGFMGAMHGRYFMPALPAFFYLLLKGWGNILPEKWRNSAFTIFVALFVLNDIGTLFYVIIPAFY